MSINTCHNLCFVLCVSCFGVGRGETVISLYNGNRDFAAGTNVAVHKPANQSTTARGGSAGNANDGDPTTVHDGRRCTETLKEPSPWWSVDLLQPYPVRAVSITTRGCCGKNTIGVSVLRINRP